MSLNKIMTKKDQDNLARLYMESLNPNSQIENWDDFKNRMLQQFPTFKKYYNTSSMGGRRDEALISTMGKYHVVVNYREDSIDHYKSGSTTLNREIEKTDTQQMLLINLLSEDELINDNEGKYMKRFSQDSSSGDGDFNDGFDYLSLLMSKIKQSY
jgi:hypothetical protein